MTDKSKQFTKKFLHIGALSMSPGFPDVWRKGYNRPITLDMSKVFEMPDVRNSVKYQLATMKRVHSPDVTHILGTSPDSMAMATLVADEFELPSVYMKMGQTDERVSGQMESLPGDANVVMIHDVMAEGKKLSKIVALLQKKGITSIDIYSMFTFGMAGAIELYASLRIPLYHITSFDMALLVMEEDGTAEQKVIDCCRQWHADPLNWDSSVIA